MNPIVCTIYKFSFWASWNIPLEGRQKKHGEYKIRCCIILFEWEQSKTFAYLNYLY